MKSSDFDRTLNNQTAFAVHAARHYHPAHARSGNIIIGVIFVVGSLSGRLALMGTHSGPALAVLGCVMIGLGLLRISQARR